MESYLDSGRDKIRGIGRGLGELWRGLVLGVNYVWSDTKRNRKNVFIGVFTLVLVLSSVCLLQNAIQKSPVIFQKVAENESGEFDLLLTPRVNSETGDIDSTSDDPYDIGDTDDQVISSSTARVWVNETDVRSKLSA